MKKGIIAGCIAGSTLIILAQFGFFEAFMMFWLAGAIPGTSYSIPSNVMYGLLLTIISLVILRLVGIQVFFFDTTKNTTGSATKPASHKKSLPKRRFGQI